MVKRTLSDVLAQRGRRTRWRTVLLFAALLALQAGAFALLIGLIWGERLAFWLPELLIASVFLLLGGLLALLILARQQRTAIDLFGRTARQESDELAAASNQANALMALAAALASARDVDGLFELTLDIYQLALNDLGVPTEDQTSAIYLLDGDHLSVAAARGASRPEEGARLERHQGIGGRALARAELLVSDQPERDPALSPLAWLRDSQQVICAPLCTARGLYGLVMLATGRPLALPAGDKGWLEAIADQVALTLHSFQLEQKLAETRIAYMAAEDEERSQLRRALGEGPLRAIAAVALRLGLIRTMIIKDPAQAALELGKMERQTRRAADELDDLVSTMRALDLDVADFDRALATTLQAIHEEFGLDLRVGRRAADAHLSRQVQAVILYVLEGSLAQAGKRGKATTAEINYWTAEDHFHLSIDDDGYGRSQSEGQAIARGDELATAVMRAKLARIGGRLEVTPGSGRGVTMLLVTPLDHQGLPLKV
jgi:signal transduction histidine kinase